MIQPIAMQEAHKGNVLKNQPRTNIEPGFVWQEMLIPKVFQKAEDPTTWSAWSWVGVETEKRVMGSKSLSSFAPILDASSRHAILIDRKFIWLLRLAQWWQKGLESQCDFPRIQTFYRLLQWLVKIAPPTYPKIHDGCMDEGHIFWWNAWRWRSFTNIRRRGGCWGRLPRGPGWIQGVLEDHPSGCSDRITPIYKPWISAVWKGSHEPQGIGDFFRIVMGWSSKVEFQQLLMVQKSGYCNHLGWCWNPVNNGINYISTGAGSPGKATPKHWNMGS